MNTTTANRARNYVNDWRTVEVDGRTYYVHRYSILSTDRVIHATYEAMTGSSHSSFMTGPKGVWVGQLTSRRLPAEIDAIPVGQRRFDACDGFRAANEDESYRAIVLAYPETAYSERAEAHNGEIETTLA